MKQRNSFVVMSKLIRLVKPMMGFMILAVVMGLFGNLCAAFLTILGGYAVLDLLNLNTFSHFNTIFICILIFAVLRAVLRYAEQTCNHYIAFKLLALIRDKVFLALRKLCPAKLDGRKKGDLIAVITSDIELLEVFYAHTISPAAIAFLFTVILCLFIGSFHPILGFLSLLAYLTVGIIIPFTISKSKKGRSKAELAMEFRTRSGELSGFVLDSLRGLSEILQYNQGKNRLAEIDEKTDALSEDEKLLKHAAGQNIAATNTAILIFDLCMLFVSALLYQRGSIDFSGVLIPTIALFSSFGPAAALANLGNILQNTIAAGNRVLDILDETPVTKEITNGKDIIFYGAEIKDITFSYHNYSDKNTSLKTFSTDNMFNENNKVLDGFSLSITPNKIMGITGKSGSGKSTLLKLLMRFWKTDDGEILLSDTSIEQINTKNLRELESFVTQETFLFHDSIKNNLKIAKLSATDKEIEMACRKASIHDFIMGLPQGYDTLIGELGDTLSGGERQRLGLARAFLHNAPFLLLDEPTSNLDSLNEAVILKSLREKQENKTIVLVSHRQSTMRVVDAVYSVES